MPNALVVSYRPAHDFCLGSREHPLHKPAAMPAAPVVIGPVQQGRFPFAAAVFFSADQDAAPQAARTHDIEDGYFFLKPHDILLRGLDLTVLS